MAQRWSECGAFIRQKRVDQRITQAQLAKAIDKSSSLVSRIESGERRPSHRELLRLSEVLGVRVQVLQKKAGYTPEFDWYAAFVSHKEDGKDILLTATDTEKEELRQYLLYIRFRATIYGSEQSITQGFNR